VEGGLVGLLASFREVGDVKVHIEFLSKLLLRKTFEPCNAVSVMID
jgi:hypothetical protein